MSREKSRWSIVGKEAVSSGDWLDHERWKVSHSSNPSRIYDYEMIGIDDYVMVVGQHPCGDAVLTVQDRVAEGLSLEAVAGKIEISQTQEEAALKEFCDESGWSPGRLVPLGGRSVSQTDRLYSRTPGNDGAKSCFMFLALNLEPSQQRLEESEKVRVVLVQWSIAVRAAFTGEIVPRVNLPIVDMSTRLNIILADNYLQSQR